MSVPKESYRDIGWRNVLYATRAHFVAFGERDDSIHSVCGLVIEKKRVRDTDRKVRQKCKTCVKALGLAP